MQEATLSGNQATLSGNFCKTTDNASQEDLIGGGSPTNPQFKGG